MTPLTQAALPCLHSLCHTAYSLFSSRSRMQSLSSLSRWGHHSIWPLVALWLHISGVSPRANPLWPLLSRTILLFIAKVGRGHHQVCTPVHLLYLTWQLLGRCQMCFVEFSKLTSQCTWGRESTCTISVHVKYLHGSSSLVSECLLNEFIFSTPHEVGSAVTHKFAGEGAEA